MVSSIILFSNQLEKLVTDPLDIFKSEEPDVLNEPVEEEFPVWQKPSGWSPGRVVGRFIQQVAERGLQMVKRKQKVLNPIKGSGRQKGLWEWSPTDQAPDAYRVTAMTKSEARAIFKSMFNLKRLPVGAVIERVG